MWSKGILDYDSVYCFKEIKRMHRQTGEKFVDPTAMSRQMREVSDF